MRREIRVPREIQADTKVNLLTVLDWFIIFGSVAVGLLTKFLVYPIIGLPYVLLFPIVTFVALMPSFDVPGKKNYKVAIQVLFKDRNIYKSITQNDIDKLLEGENDAV